MKIVFCKQKTAYELRVCDWSSDVCSADLIGASFGRQWSAVRNEGRIASRPRIIGTEQTWITEAVIHQPQIISAGRDVVARMVRIVSEPEPPTHVGPRPRPDLHEPHCARMADDRAAAQRRAPTALGAHHRSAARSVGKECVRTFSSRWAPHQ